MNTINRFKKLPRSFYLRPTVQVAKELLGTYLVRKLPNETLIGKIVEVEAYRFNDPASHAYRGKTKRNEVMFRQGGYLYVYFTYGMHFCSNVVTENEDVACAVLLRGIEPIKGIKRMEKNRGLSGYTLTNGPAKICQAFELGKSENEVDLTGESIYLTVGEPVAKKQIGISTRIGITAGLEKKWRFFIKDSPWVSRKTKIK